MPYKTELHMHTGDISVCARVTPEEAVRDYKAAGYRTIVVTNHMNRATFQHMAGASWEEQIQWYVTARKKILDYAEAGDNIGALLRGIDRDQIERGQVLAVPGSVHPHTTFDGHVYVLKKEEGGRHTPFFNNYRPQFYFRTTDVTGIITLPEGTEMCMPGDNVDMHVELITPVAMEEGMRFAIREGGHTVGSGVVSKIEK